MSKRPLNPEVVVRALRAFLGLQSELMTRVAAFITQNIPSEPELAENLTRCVPKDDPFQVTQFRIGEFLEEHVFLEYVA